jgi:hypothetical protein
MACGFSCMAFASLTVLRTLQSRARERGEFTQLPGRDGVCWNDRERCGGEYPHCAHRFADDDELSARDAPGADPIRQVA